MSNELRKIETHHDGHGLNESIIIEADGPGPGNASHEYHLAINVGPGFVRRVIQFQKGPRNVEGSLPGLTDAALLAIVRDRLKAFRVGKYACHENAVALQHVDYAMQMMRARADSRAKRGVLGTYQK